MFRSKFVWLRNNVLSLCLGIGAVAAIIGMALVIVWLFSADKAQAKVTKLTWTHTVDVRQREVRHGSDWGRTYHDGYYNEPTFNQYCERQKRGTWCCGGYDDKSKCKKSCNNYDDWCRYNYYEWPIITSHTIQGEGHGEMPWPNVVEDNNRRAERSEHYNIEFKNGSKAWSYGTASLNRYNQFEIDDIWNLRLPHVGDVEAVSKAQLEKN